MFTTQSPIFIRHKIDYSKSYQAVIGEESNIDGNLKKNIDLSEHISKRFVIMVMLERKHRNNSEGSCSGSSDDIVLMSSLMEKRHLNQTQQIVEFLHRIGNQNYNISATVETSGDQLPQ